MGTWHFDKSRWGRSDVGDLLPERGSAVSSRDIWAVGAQRSTGCGDRTVAHYDGRRWSAVPVGDALPPDIPQPDEGGPYQCVHLRDVLATSRRDVWVTGNVYRSDGGDQTEELPVLAHWDGRTWRREDIPGKWIPNRLASDGRGGLWITGWDDPYGPTPEATPLMDRAADGTLANGDDRRGRSYRGDQGPGARAANPVAVGRGPDRDTRGERRGRLPLPLILCRCPGPCPGRGREQRPGPCGYTKWPVCLETPGLNYRLRGIPYGWSRVVPLAER